jgi:hypothetical protein
MTLRELFKRSPFFVALLSNDSVTKVKAQNYSKSVAPRRTKSPTVRKQLPAAAAATPWYKTNRQRFLRNPSTTADSSENNDESLGVDACVWPRGHWRNVFHCL